MFGGWRKEKGTRLTVHSRAPFLPPASEHPTDTSWINWGSFLLFVFFPVVRSLKKRTSSKICTFCPIKKRSFDLLCVLDLFFFSERWQSALCQIFSMFKTDKWRSPWLAAYSSTLDTSLKVESWWLLHNDSIRWAVQCRTCLGEFRCQNSFGKTTVKIAYSLGSLPLKLKLCMTDTCVNTIMIVMFLI